MKLVDYNCIEHFAGSNPKSTAVDDKQKARDDGRNQRLALRLSTYNNTIV